MSEQLLVCKALAAMMNRRKEISEEEVKFVGHAAFELGLDAGENDEVQRVLKEGGDYRAIISGITSRPLRTFLFRRVVAAILLDDLIEESEQAIIDQTAEAFGYDEALKAEFVAWMQEGIRWERKGAELMFRL